MKTLYAEDEEYQAERIVKTESEIIGFIDGKEVFRFEGIRNMSVFTVDGEWDSPQLSTEEELRQLKLRQDESENAILSLMDMSLMGGM